MNRCAAAVLAYNPQLVYSTGFQLSVAAVFGILLLSKPLRSLVETTVLRPVEKPPRGLTDLLSVSLAAQISTSPIVAAAFGEGLRRWGCDEPRRRAALRPDPDARPPRLARRQRCPAPGVPAERLQRLPRYPPRSCRTLCLLALVRHRDHAGGVGVPGRTLLCRLRPRSCGGEALLAGSTPLVGRAPPTVDGLVAGSRRGRERLE